MRIFSLSLLVAVCALAAMRSPAAATNIPAGSYQNSCVSIRTSGDDVLAKCEDISGNWHAAQADMDQCPSRSYANNDGSLVCGLGGYGIAGFLPRGSWRASCSNGSDQNGTLYARCDTGSGSWRDASLNMQDCPSRIVDNSRGALVCRGGSSVVTYGGLPPGSWRTSCRNGYMQGSVLYAQCDAGNGTWHQTSIDLGRYPNARLSNQRGNLVYEGGTIYRQLQ
jgi:hypothetical protein